MTTTPAARDERLEFLKRFDLDGRFKYDENTNQFIPLTDHPEHFAMLERITACYCGWLERNTLAESELAEVREQLQLTESRLSVEVAAAENYNSRMDELRAELERVKADSSSLAVCLREQLFVDEPPEFECGKGYVIRCACKTCTGDRSLSALGSHRAAIGAGEGEAG